MVCTREFPPTEPDGLLDVRSTYQPIVELASRNVVGFEALARWPSAPDVTPDRMFEYARRTGRLDDVEWACRLAAVLGATDAGLGQRYTLFVNIEADTTPGSQPSTAPDAIVDATKLRVVVEVTERALLTDPGNLLTTMSAVRSLGYGVALDDVGSNPDSLTIMEFVAPDVVKLDRRLVQHAPGPEEAAILTAVAAYAERTPTTVLAEGIETQEHLDRALSLGATLGQGWLLGRPTALGTQPDPVADTTAAVPFFHSGLDADALWKPRTPSALFSVIEPRIAPQSLLRTLTRSIEDHARSLPEPISVVASFQDSAYFTGETADRFADLAYSNALVAVLGPEMPARPAARVRGVSFGADDPLRHEWVLTVVGRHYFAAVIAREVERPGPERMFEYVLTYDHSAVLGAARSLASRLSPVAGILPSISTDRHDGRGHR